MPTEPFSRPPIAAIRERAGRFGLQGVSRDVPALLHYVAMLEKKLILYGLHLPACASRDYLIDDDNVMQRFKCDCGWDQIREALKGKGET